MRFFSDHQVIALTSDASVDFTPVDFNLPLADRQKEYLKRKIGWDIPQVFWRRQVHGDEVLTAVGGVGVAQSCPDADAFITNEVHLPIAIRTADCVPVFIFDPVHQVIGLTHAGWKGTRLGIAAKTIKTMQDKFNCQCYDLKVVIGPAIRACCYQVGLEFKAHFPQEVIDRSGHLYFDMVGANRRQLTEAGVCTENIFDSGVCTCCDQKYFSFRRDGTKAGRMISLMMLC